MLASHHAAAAAANPFNMGYPFVSPYPTYSNGDPISMPMVSAIPTTFHIYDPGRVGTNNANDGTLGNGEHGKQGDANRGD